MLPCRFVQIVAQSRRIDKQAARGRYLGIENPQRIGLQTSPTVGVQFRLKRRQEIQQRLPIALPRFLGADRVQLQCQGVDAEFAKDARQHDEYFGVDVRPGHAERLGADLGVFAGSALLRPLVAKHRTVVPELLLAIVQQAVLDTGSCAAGGALGTQRQGVPLAIRKGVHLLFHQIGGFADATAEELGRFHQRQADLPKAVAFEDARHHRLHLAPARRFLRQDVAHPAHQLKLASHVLSAPPPNAPPTGAYEASTPPHRR